MHGLKGYPALFDFAAASPPPILPPYLHLLMKHSLASIGRKLSHQATRALMASLPRELRFGVYRALAQCDPQPDARLQLKIADTQDELEACFRILHDAYVAAGFMQPDPSGLRVTIYHALPTTTTLCAKWDGQVVGTISMIREGVFGFPLQTAFDLGPVRAKAGQIAEVSALAVAPAFRKTGGQIMFPLMKFMTDYCRSYFDTRHIVIAVNPNKIEMYESLLFFDRLQDQVVDHYDFANGAPAVGATLDLVEGIAHFEQAYGHKPDHKNLSRYLFNSRLDNIELPQRRFHTTNDPVLTPSMMDYFFNRRTQVFAGLDERKRRLLHSIYDHTSYAEALPPLLPGTATGLELRQHQRFSIRCPGRLTVVSYGQHIEFPLHVIEMSLHGFKAECMVPLPENTCGHAEVDLGAGETARVEATAVQRQTSGGLVYYGFVVPEPDTAWQRCVAALNCGRTHADLATLPRLPSQQAATHAHTMQQSVSSVTSVAALP